MVDSEPSPVAAVAPPARTVGDVLRNARVANELTVEQLAGELRIEARQLRALEDNRFDQIGVAVFVKGYIRQYGQRFGLDVADLLSLYYEHGRLEEIALKPSQTIKLRDERQISYWIVAVLLLLTIVVGFAAWWWNGGSFDTARFTSAMNGAGARTSAAADEAPAPAAALAPPTAAPTANAPPADVVQPVAEPPAPAVGAEVSDEDAVDETLDAGAAVLIPLEFSFTEESWAEVTDARGERLLFGLTAAGRQVTVRGESPFDVVLGNAEAVRLRVDGVDFPIPTVGRQGNLARFSVNIDEE